MTDAEWTAVLASPTPIEGWFSWLHHDVPIEWTLDLLDRCRYIDTQKPAHERATRRHCIVAVEEAALPRASVEASRAYAEARHAYAEAGHAYAAALHAYAEARHAFDAASRADRAELVTLALRLVPDAPWAGSALVFPEKPR